MNIEEFYKKLSRIIEMCREKSISHGEAEFKLNELKKEAELSNLDINISDNILDMNNLIKYDDEISYEEESSSYESSYDEDAESSY